MDLEEQIVNPDIDEVMEELVNEEGKGAAAAAAEDGPTGISVGNVLQSTNVFKQLNNITLFQSPQQI